MDKGEKEKASRLRFDWKKALLAVGLLIVLSNLLVLDYFLWFEGEGDDFNKKLESLEDKVKKLSYTQREIENKISSTSLEAAPQASPTIVFQDREKEKVVEKVITQVEKSQVKEFYIPLGSATARTEKFNWLDTGAEATLDLSNYSGVQEVNFEATLSVESGEVEARLYNVTDGNPIVGSTLLGKGLTPKLQSSGNLVLHPGSKTYRVQMRTSLNYEAQMDNARIRILVE